MSGKPFENLDGGGHVCGETSGFLFSHPCEQIARSNCHRCGKPICNQHAVYDEGNNLCITCSKLDPETEKPGTQTDGSRRERYHDPYWYAYVYYDDYSWRADDFNDADEGVLVSGDDGVEWEDDMGAS